MTCENYVKFKFQCPLVSFLGAQPCLAGYCILHGYFYAAISV